MGIASLNFRPDIVQRLACSETKDSLDRLARQPSAEHPRLEQIEQDREKRAREQPPAKSTQGSARFQVASNQAKNRIFLEPVDAIRAA